MMKSYVYSSNSSLDNYGVVITRRSPRLCRKKVNRNAFLQLGLIVLSFSIGYLPISAYYTWTTITLPERNPYTDYWFGVISYMCMRFSECMNPLMYSIGSSKLRVEIKSVLSSFREKCFCFSLNLK